MAQHSCCCHCCGIRHFSDEAPRQGERIAFGHIMRGCERCKDVPANHREKWIRAATKAYLEKELTETDREMIKKYGRIR